LSWEDLGRHSPGNAFFESLRELILHPLRFFDRMATDGGLREPLTFFWIMATAVVLLAFPLALAHLGLTAPDPAEVSPATYSRYLLVPRIAGFALVLLPVILLAAGIMEVVTGSIFHLASRLFSSGTWEAAVSIWLYAKSAAAFPVVLAEALLCAVAVAAYLLVLSFPATETIGLRIAQLCPWIMIGAVAISVATFLLALVAGCTRTFHLEPATATAAALSGVLLTLLIGAGPAYAWLLRGPAGTGIAMAADILILAFLAVLGHFLLSPGRARSPDEACSQ
jgi:hypothetical protein